MNSTVITLSDITNPDPNEVLYAIPLGIISTLPWWTSFPSTIVDLLMSLKSVTLDWSQHFGDSDPSSWEETLSWKDKGMVSLTALELLYTFIQIIAGFAHVGRYGGWRQQFLRYASPTSYALVFSATVRMWTKLAFQNLWVRISTWILAPLSLVLFILLHLPGVGTGPLYQLWAPGCIVIPYEYEYANLGNTSYYYSCANTSDLALYGDSTFVVPIGVNWAFIGATGALLLWTFVIHLQYLSTKHVNYQQRIAGTITSLLFFFVLAMVIMAFISDATIANSSNIYTDAVVCPGMSNMSGPVQLSTDSYGTINDTRCWDVSVELPDSIPDLTTAVQLDKANIAHLIFNF